MKSSVFHTVTRKAQWVWFAASKGVICRRGVGIKNPGGNGDSSEPIVTYISWILAGSFVVTEASIYLCYPNELGNSESFGAYLGGKP